MSYTLIRHQVADFEAWKEHFDAHDETRREYGQLGYELLTGGDDQTDVTILFEWESPEQVQAFMKESDIENVMKEAGVVGEPEILELELVESIGTHAPIA